MCVPEVSRRAYVTTLVGDDHTLSPRVLAKSLSRSGAKADIVVLISEDRADPATVGSLRQDGLIVKVVEPLLPSADKLERLTVLSRLWGLVEYDRIVFLDPRSLVTRNPDSLFACDGFCAVMSPPIDVEEGGGKTVYGSVFVLQPSSEMESELLDSLLVHNGSGVGAASPHTLPSFMIEKLSLDAACRPFEELEDFAPAGPRESRKSSGRSDAPGDDDWRPLLVLKADHLPTCAAGASSSRRAAGGTCHQLPYTYSAPSADFERDGGLSSSIKMHAGGNVNPFATSFVPHVIHFSDSDRPWDGRSYTGQPLYWLWSSYRAELNDTLSGDPAAPYFLLLFPLLLLMAAHLHDTIEYHYTWRLLRGKRKDSDEYHSGDEWTKVTAPLAEARLPLRRAISAPCPTIQGIVSPALGEICLLPRLVLAIVGALLAYYLYGAGAAWGEQVVEEDWPPMLGAAVRGAWLCCLMCLGIHLLDYLLYTFHTKGQTLKRDAACGGAFLLLAWASPIPLPSSSRLCSVVAVAMSLASAQVRRCRRSSTHRLSTPAHFTLIILSAIIVTGVSPWYPIVSTTCQSVAISLIYGSLMFPHELASLFMQNSHSDSSGSQKLKDLSADGGSVNLALDLWQHLLLSIIKRWDKIIAVFALAWMLTVVGSDFMGAGSGDGRVYGRPVKGRVYYGEQCIYGEAGYISGEGSSLESSCGPLETLRPMLVSLVGDIYGIGSDAAHTTKHKSWWQRKNTREAVCLRTPSGKFLTPLRGRLADACTEETWFVLQTAGPDPCSAEQSVERSSGELSVRNSFRRRMQHEPLQIAAPQPGYCLYNPHTGLYLSSLARPQPLCRRSEQWYIDSFSW